MARFDQNGARRRFCWGGLNALLAIAGKQLGKLIRGLSPAFVKVHLFVGFPVGRAPMQHARGIFGFSAFVLKGDDAGHEWFIRWFPYMGVGIGQHLTLILDNV